MVLEGFRLSLARAIQLDINSLKHCSQIARDVRIPKSNNAVSFLLQPKLPLTIALGRLVLIVMPAVQLDD